MEAIIVALGWSGLMVLVAVAVAIIYHLLQPYDN